jgi:hypothetical protein
LTRSNQVLLFHLKNHYALIFAAREWVDDSSWGGDDGATAAAGSAGAGASAVLAGGCVRQILTARKGQRPAAWMDFAEVREVMLGWDGYKIIALSSCLDREQLLKMLVHPAHLNRDVVLPLEKLN